MHLNKILSRYKSWLPILKEVVREYSGQTLDNVIVNVEKVIKEIEKNEDNRK
jgi:hypothetical protein